MTIVDKIKYAWGANQSIGFKLGSWAVAAGIAYGAYVFTSESQPATEFTDAESWNKQVLAKKGKKTDA
ncbi:hypothetical protein LEN26_019491 [Aphanomyces euteiches]|nr:hypothetical protein LEN26_019491 [Aphanomyces euteiches]KAH9115926.1 hypothetical protein AeMF1_010073 [Aphanomyces euteiches]KAH9195856.1 hypothetical protein AeNC1_002164 [Aphanomyces euteiches]